MNNGAGNRELTDKVQRIYHQLEEFKKSYFKKMKDLDLQLGQRPTKENLNATESMLLQALTLPEKLLDILELSFAQLGERFANKNQTSEAIFKLKSQVKNAFASSFKSSSPSSNCSLALE